MKEAGRKEEANLPPCPNPECGESHVVRNGSHRGRQRYCCRTCQTYFGETQGTPMYGLKTPEAEVVQALLIVMRRGSLRAAEEITGHKYETISGWLKQAASHVSAITQILARDLHLSQVEIDEFWLFVQKNGAACQPDEGERWGCLVQDRASRFVVACATSPLNEDLIEQAVKTTVERTQRRPLSWFSDGWHGYRTILERAYRKRVVTGKRGRPRLVVPPQVSLTQTVKHRDEHGRLLRVEIRAALGAHSELAGTVHIERLNGALRDRFNALTRKTHAFAKRDDTWDALVDLQLFDHNFHRPHRALRLPACDGRHRYQQRSPAMALGVTDHRWSFHELLTTRMPITP